MLNQLRLLRDVSALVLIAATWRLWFAASDFPAVPLYSSLTDVPRSVDRIFSGLLVTSLLINVAVTAARVSRHGDSVSFAQIGRACDSAFALSGVALILLNQHCLQPWMYHVLILTPLLWLHAPRPVASADSKRSEDETCPTGGSVDYSRQAIIWLTASIYVWSAWSKLDWSFLHSHGPKFVNAICEAVGLSTQFWSDRTWLLAAACLSVGELLVGVAFLFRKTRACGLAASVVMHLLLMVAVGPWGLDHKTGVLLWNGYFIVQNVMLFLAERRFGAASELPSNDSAIGSSHAGRASKGTPQRAVFVVVVGAILFPAFRAVGCCDTWPAWAVYASSPARILVQLRDNEVERLPKTILPFVEPRRINDGWSWLRIDLWSLAATGTPIYPEDRFQLAVARSIAEDADLGGGILIIHDGEADRWTGIRERSDVSGAAEIAELESRFHLNTTPRCL
jgi:hypothetical protein